MKISENRNTIIVSHKINNLTQFVISCEHGSLSESQILEVVKNRYSKLYNNVSVKKIPLVSHYFDIQVSYEGTKKTLTWTYIQNVTPHK